jgi:hypothetical protein
VAPRKQIRLVYFDDLAGKASVFPLCPDETKLPLRRTGTTELDSAFCFVLTEAQYCMAWGLAQDYFL